ncbi:MAG: branched-chain amino acid ABC transporter permease [Phycisphaeraceae bacterium]|nr:MAG: branched-chain amino acid ABC transporter permease [Phycisphaeraceae bacterium]
MHLAVRPNLNRYEAGLAMGVCINVMLAVSLNIVNGFTGQFSMGHAGFLAVGGYAAGIVSYYGSIAIFGDAETHGGVLSSKSLNAPIPTAWFAAGELLFLGSLIVGGIVAGIVGFLVGLPSLRLRGDYLAIVTLGFGEIVRVTIQQTRPVLDPGETLVATPWYVLPTHIGGALGFSGTPKYTSLFWVTLGVVLTVTFAYRLKTSTFGRAMIAIREDEIAAEAMGVPTTKYKVRAFVIAAFIAGVAGGLYGHFKSMNPNEVGFVRSFEFVTMVVLGGLGSISGAAIAAVLVTLLPEWLRFMADYRMMVWSLALVLMMIFRPTGLLGVKEIWEVRFRSPKAAPAKPGGGGGGGAGGGGGGGGP